MRRHHGPVSALSWRTDHEVIELVGEVIMVSGVCCFTCAAALAALYVSAILKPPSGRIFLEILDSHTICFMTSHENMIPRTLLLVLVVRAENVSIFLLHLTPAPAENLKNYILKWHSNIRF